MSWSTELRAWLRQMLRRAAGVRMDGNTRFRPGAEAEPTPAEASRRAASAADGEVGDREEVRRGRGLSVLDELLRDVRHACRSLVRERGFTLVAVLTLALGIGAATAMFSVLDGVLLRALPVREQQELVVLWTRAPGGASDHMPVSQGELTDFRRRTRVFSGVAGVAYQGASQQALRDGERTVAASGTWVTGDLLPLLGVVPVHGRTLLPADDVPGAAPVMVIGHALWQRHFGGDPSVVGRALEWNGRWFTVVGVMPRGFEYPRGAEFWAPVFAVFPEEAQKSWSGYVIYDLVGRLGRGAGVEEARADLRAYLRESDEQRPAALRGMEPVVTPLPELIQGEVRSTLWTSAAAVGLLLLIACANVANLLLIRGSARARELAIRTALGAGRSRLVRQLLTETGVLAVLGGALGVGLAHGAVRLLVRLAPPELPRREMIEVDARVLGFALAVTLAVTLLAGLLPALLSAARDLGGWLRGGERTTSAGRGVQALRHGLVVGQVALAVLVVGSAGLLVRSLMALQSVEMGFDEDRLVIARTALPAEAAPDRARQLLLLEGMLARVAAIPGVASAAWLPSSPFSGEGGWTAPYAGEGQSAESQATNPMLNLESVGPEYFGTMQLPIRRGRAFSADDREDSPLVAIVSEAVARHTWPGVDPIGRRIKLGSLDGPGEWHTVVGVVGETRYRELAEPQPSLYLPTRQFGPMPLGLAVRTRGAVDGLVPQIRRALRETHPQWTLVSGGSVRELMAAPLARPRFSALLLATLAAITLLLAVVGIYGAMATLVRQRTREIGIRLALGARVGEVRALVLRQGMRLALWGCALGTTGALLAARALRDLLFGVRSSDPLTFAAVAALMLAAAALACAVPARRASRVDPTWALRAE